jgi:hypothetical protein
MKWVELFEGNKKDIIMIKGFPVELKMKIKNNNKR